MIFGGFDLSSLLVDLQKTVTNVVGMSIEKMWRNDEMTNFGIFTQPIPMFLQNWDSQDSAETAAHIT